MCSSDLENTKQHFWIQWQNTVLTDQLTLSQNGIETNAILKFQVQLRGGADGDSSSQESASVSNGRARISRNCSVLNMRD